MSVDPLPTRAQLLLAAVLQYVPERRLEQVAKIIAAQPSYPANRDLIDRAGALLVEKARPLDDWHEDFGPVLWWRFPIEESPYVGTPLDEDWPDYHTHWTPLPALPPEPTP